jgi:hypothetical protein
VWFLIILALVLALPALIVLYLSHRTSYDVRHREFALGLVPDPPLNGPHLGTIPGVEGLTSMWRGKRFDASTSTGINQLCLGQSVSERFPFRTYVANGWDDADQRVLRIDYNIQANPFWLRAYADEVVETQPGHYLAKAYLRLFPGHSTAILFFELRADSDRV